MVYSLKNASARYTRRNGWVSPKEGGKKHSFCIGGDHWDKRRACLKVSLQTHRHPKGHGLGPELSGSQHAGTPFLFADASHPFDQPGAEALPSVGSLDEQALDQRVL